MNNRLQLQNFYRECGNALSKAAKASIYWERAESVVALSAGTSPYTLTKANQPQAFKGQGFFWGFQICTPRFLWILRRPLVSPDRKLASGEHNSYSWPLGLATTSVHTRLQIMNCTMYCQNPTYSDFSRPPSSLYLHLDPLKKISAAEILDPTVGGVPV